MPAGHSKVGCCLFLCPLFWGTLSACTLSSTSECRNAGFVPGARLAGEGYDVVTLQSKGTFVIDMNTWHTANGICTLCRNGLQGWGVGAPVAAHLPGRLAHPEFLPALALQPALPLGCPAGGVGGIRHHQRLATGPLPRAQVTTNLVLVGSKSRMVEFGTSCSKRDRYSFTSHQFQCHYYQYRVKDKP
eukprot:g22473.t1